MQNIKNTSVEVKEASIVINNLIENPLEFVKDLFFEKIKILNEKLDESINKKIWISNGYETRTMEFLFGPASFKRRVYKNRFSKRKYIPLDKTLKIGKYKRVHNTVYKAVIESLVHCYSYSDLIKVNKLCLSEMSISRIVKANSFNVVPKNLSEKTEVLFISIDDIHVHKHKSKKGSEQRCAVAWTVENGKKTKMQFINIDTKTFKADGSTSRITPKNQASELYNILEFVYGKIGSIIIVGDGASIWDTYAEHLSNLEIQTTRVLDAFHFKKWINDYEGIGKSSNKLDWGEFNKIIDTNQLEDWLTLNLDLNDNNPKQKGDKDLLKRILKWFPKYKEGVQLKVQSFIEGMQSNFVAKFTKHRRAFSEEVIGKLLKFVSANFNGWDVIESKDYNRNVKIIIDVDFEYIKDDNRILPIYEHGKTNTINMFNNILKA